MPRTAMVDRIESALGRIRDPNDEDHRVLTSIRRQILNHPEHEYANSMAVLNSLAIERLRRTKESS